MKRYLFLFLTCLLLVALAIPACAPKAKDENVFKIAVVGPMQFVQGEHHWMGATMAAEEINKAGGMKIGDKNYMIKLIKVDSNEILDIAGAASSVERAITLDKADMLIGGFRTEAVFPMSDVAMDYKKIFINCGAATAALQKRVNDDYDRYKYFFKGTPYNEYFLVTTDFKILAMVSEMLKQELGMQTVKVAIIAEKLEWAEAMVALANARLPAMGYEVVGTWRPSDTATDVTAELTAIAAKKPHIIFTTFSGPVGITYAKQRGELKIPACSVGINVEGQKKGFWEATGGKGNYETFLNTYAEGVSMTEKTIPFFNEFVRRTGEFPAYTAATYDVVHSTKINTEAAGSFDADVQVPVIEKQRFVATSGVSTYYQVGEKAVPPKCAHDLVYGPGLLTGVGTQWIDGKLVGIWPKKEYGTVDDYGDWKIEYPGTVPYTIPPEVIAEFKGKPAEPEPAKPAGPVISEYVNAEYGLSIKYPKEWQPQDVKPPTLLYAVAAAQVPVLSVSARGEAAFADAIKTSLTEGGGSDIKVGAEKETTLADGTKATVAKVDWTVKGFPGETYALGVKKGDKWIVVTITTVAMLVPYDEAKFSDIAKTLQFKK